MVLAILSWTSSSYITVQFMVSVSFLNQNVSHSQDIFGGVYLYLVDFFHPYQEMHVVYYKRFLLKFPYYDVFGLPMRVYLLHRRAAMAQVSLCKCEV